MIPFPNQLCDDSFEELILFKNSKILEITLSVTCVILCFYFIVASFNGEFGVAAKYELLAREKVLTRKLNLLIEENIAIKNKVERLSDTSLDLELLDQQARKILGMIGENEVIIILNKS